MNVEYGRAIPVPVPPQDFSRIVSGACFSAEREVRKASEEMARLYGLSTSDGAQSGDKSIAQARTLTIARYTKEFYQRDAKPESKQENTTKPPKQVAKGGSTGSGLLVSADGYILTNAHVIDQCQEVRARLANQSYKPASIVVTNKNDDLAILKIAPVASIKFASFRIGKTIRQGEPVVVYGFPWLPILASSGNVSTGIVTALAGVGDNAHHLQISAPVQSGNSGGPLLDESGNVIGVVVAKLGLKAMDLTKDMPQNLNFAIKAPIAAAFMDAHGISYSTATSDAVLSVPDVGDRAKLFTVNIECEG